MAATMLALSKPGTRRQGCIAYAVRNFTASFFDVEQRYIVLDVVVNQINAEKSIVNI
jgi:hypothetical protein